MFFLIMQVNEVNTRLQMYECILRISTAWKYCMSVNGKINYGINLWQAMMSLNTGFCLDIE